MESLNWALRFLRKSRSLNQRQVAEAIRAPPSTVSAWEMGRRRPSLERLGQLADLLDLDLGDLDDALELAGAFPLRRRPREVVLAPERIAQALYGRAEVAPRDPLKEVLEALFALADRLRERGWGEPPDRGARPPGLSRMATLSDALYILRTSRQVRQSEIADALEIHPAVVSGWEHGKGRPSLERFGQIADRLRLDLGELDDALERTARIGYHRRRPRRPVPGVDLDPVSIAARLLGRRPGERTDPAQAELERLLESLFILVEGLGERSPHGGGDSGEE
jgi:transcriptional regulator with XRE-family HTH domain